MDIHQLETEVRCLQCEAEGRAVHDCEIEYSCQECKDRIEWARIRLVGVWDADFRR